jgi:hypothetical protein
MRLLDTLVEKTKLCQEPQIDTDLDLVLEFKFVTRSVENIRMPLKTVLEALPAHTPARSRQHAVPLGLLAWEFGLSEKEGQLPD